LVSPAPDRPDLRASADQRRGAADRTDRRISRGDCDQRSSRSATCLLERERTER
jgi:hypothetical protein